MQNLKKDIRETLKMYNKVFYTATIEDIKELLYDRYFNMSKGDMVNYLLPDDKYTVDFAIPMSVWHKYDTMQYITVYKRNSMKPRFINIVKYYKRSVQRIIDKLL